MNDLEPSFAAELEILEDLVKHARKLALTKDPAKRIVASRWEILLTAKVSELKAAPKQSELFSVVDHDQEALRAAEE